MPAPAATGAPAVWYPVGRSRRFAVFLGAPWLLGVTALFYLLFSGFDQSGIALQALILILFLALSGLALRAFWRHQSARTLIWDGTQWAVTEGAHERPLASVDVRLDLQRVLLLRAHGRSGQANAWLWAEASVDRGRWHLLRCALYSGGPVSARTVSSTDVKRF